MNYVVIMECEIISNLIRNIQDKRKEFIEQNGRLPNMIVMDRANQVLLNMHFINKIGTEMNTVYNMKILVDNSIMRPEDIKLYYWSEFERQDVGKNKIDKLYTWFQLDKGETTEQQREEININFKNICEKLDEVISEVNKLKNK